MTRMKSLTDHLAAIHARIKENAEKKLAEQPELDLGIDDDQAAPEQPQHFGIEPTREIPGEEPTQIPGEEPTRQTPGEGPTREIPTDPWARPKDAE